jgi:hypothetical protein
LSQDQIAGTLSNRYPEHLEKRVSHQTNYNALYILRKGEPEDFKEVLPNAFRAADWFRFHGTYSNGENIL